MKYALLLMTVVFFLPLFSNGAIPISTTEQRIEQEVKVQPLEKEKTVKNKSTKKTSFFKRIVKKLLLRVPSEEGAPIFNALALTFGIMSFAAVIAAIAAVSMTFIYVGVGLGIVAIAFGIVGLTTGEKGKGMGIAGLVVGGVFTLINLLVVAIDNAL